MGELPCASLPFCPVRVMRSIPINLKWQIGHFFLELQRSDAMGVANPILLDSSLAYETTAVIVCQLESISLSNWLGVGNL
jgi:hypothetical protein